MTRHPLVVCAIAALTLVSAAIAQQSITVTPPQYATINGNNVTIDAASAPNDQQFSITTSSGTGFGDLGVVTVNVGNGSGRRAYLSISNVNNIGGIVKGANQSAELWISSVLATQNIGVDSATPGSITANIIQSIESNWNIYADITATGSAISPTTTPINTLSTNVVNPMWTDDGNITGHITSAGPIFSIDARNDLGSGDINNPQVITANGAISFIAAAGLSGVQISNPNGALASLSTRVRGWGGDEILTRERADLPNQPSPSSFNPPRYTVGGTLNADSLGVLEIRKGLVGTAFTLAKSPGPSQVWRIGTSIASTSSITLPAVSLPNFGLRHQVVVNAHNEGGEWLGPVYLGTGSNRVSLQDSYANIPSTFGGGAVGEVPYKQHGPASNPAKNGVVLGGMIDPTSTQEPPPCEQTILNILQVEFYGNIDVPGTQQPGQVVSVVGWDPRIQGSITTYTPTGVTTNTRTMTITLAQTINANQIVGVTVKGDKVRCRDLATGVGDVYIPEFTYYFTVTGGCEDLFDLSRNGRVGWEDMATYLGEPVDFDENGVINNRDASILIRGISEQPQQP